MLCFGLLLLPLTPKFVNRLAQNAAKGVDKAAKYYKKNYIVARDVEAEEIVAKAAEAPPVKSIADEIAEEQAAAIKAAKVAAEKKASGELKDKPDGCFWCL